MEPGRNFLPRLIDLSMTMSELHNNYSLSQEAKFDILWWRDFLSLWNDSGIIKDNSVYELHIYTEASKLGMGEFLRIKNCLVWPRGLLWKRDQF